MNLVPTHFRVNETKEITKEIFSHYIIETPNFNAGKLKTRGKWYKTEDEYLQRNRKRSP